MIRAAMDQPRPVPFSLPAEIAGWYGMVAILGGYALSTLDVLTTGDLLYKLMNLTGALGVAWVCLHKRTWQAFWLETAWAVFAVLSLFKT